MPSYGSYDEKINVPEIEYTLQGDDKDPGFTVSYTIDGKKADFAALEAGTYLVTATFTGSQNYNDAVKTFEVEVKKIAMDVRLFNVPDGGDYSLWGTDASRYHGESYKTVLDGDVIKVSGEVYYIADVNAGATSKIF